MRRPDHYILSPNVARRPSLGTAAVEAQIAVVADSPIHNVVAKHEVVDLVHRPRRIASLYNGPGLHDCIVSNSDPATICSGKEIRSYTENSIRAGVAVHQIVGY